MMTKCRICHNVYGDWRVSCPACGANQISRSEPFTILVDRHKMIIHQIVVAFGCERARQLPQSPRVFQLVD